jgi:hypothetical protein
MNDRDNLSERQLDDLISSHYRPLGAAPVPVRLHGRIVRTVQARMERRAADRTGLRRLPRLAAAMLAILCIVAVALASLPMLWRGPTIPAEATASASAFASASPAPLPTTDPALFSTDARLKACGGLDAGIEAVVPLDHAWAYRAVLPGLGFVPLLDDSNAPALLVVYSGAIPPSLNWWNGERGRFSVGSPAPIPTQPPGIRNVCAALPAEQSAPTGSGLPDAWPNTQIVLNVPIAPFYAGNAALTVKPATPRGRARVVAQTNPPTNSMAWDPRRSVLWYVVQVEPGNDSALYELDPATGTVKHWGLPYTDYPGWDDMIVVDATGAVWFSYRGGVMLFRFDPASGKLARRDLNLKVEPAGNSSSGETPITAIAADGDGVLIAREGLPYPFLTHVDSSMKEGEFVPLANIPIANVPLAVRPWIEVMELGVVDNRLIIGTEPGALAVYSRQGQRIASLPQIKGAYGGDGSLARLIPDGSDLVAVPGEDSLTLLDATGAVVSTVPLSIDLPVGQSSMEVQFGPQCLATDWHGIYWYAWGGYIVEVQSESPPPVTAPVGSDGFGSEAVLALAACLLAAAAFVTLRRFVLACR